MAATVTPDRFDARRRATSRERRADARADLRETSTPVLLGLPAVTAA